MASDSNSTSDVLRRKLLRAAGPHGLKACTLLVTDRMEPDYMDGRESLYALGKTYIKPWDHCITADALSKDNLPPFYVRLRDDQVGHLLDSHVMSNQKLSKYWATEFLKDGRLKPTRDHWGPAYVEYKEAWGGRGLPGGKAMPDYTPLPSRPTYTSMSKQMSENENKPCGQTLLKRKSSLFSDESIQRPPKKLCLWRSDSPVIKPEANAVEETDPMVLPLNSPISPVKAITQMVAELEQLREEKQTLEKKNAQDRADAQSAYDALDYKWQRYDKKKEKAITKLIQHSEDRHLEQYEISKKVSSELKATKNRLKSRGERLKAENSLWNEQVGELKTQIRRLLVKTEQMVGGDDERGSEDEDSSQDGDDDEEVSNNDDEKHNNGFSEHGSKWGVRSDSNGPNLGGNVSHDHLGEDEPTVDVGEGGSREDVRATSILVEQRPTPEYRGTLNIEGKEKLQVLKHSEHESVALPISPMMRAMQTSTLKGEHQIWQCVDKVLDDAMSELTERDPMVPEADAQT